MRLSDDDLRILRLTLKADAGTQEAIAEAAKAEGDGVVCENSAERSCGLAMVVVEQSTETLAPLNAGVRAGWWWCPLQQPVPQSLVVSLTMVVLDVLPDDES